MAAVKKYQAVEELVGLEFDGANSYRIEISNGKKVTLKLNGEGISDDKIVHILLHHLSTLEETPSTVQQRAGLEMYLAAR